MTKKPTDPALAEIYAAILKEQMKHRIRLVVCNPATGEK